MQISIPITIKPKTTKELIDFVGNRFKEELNSMPKARAGMRWLYSLNNCTKECVVYDALEMVRGKDNV